MVANPASLEPLEAVPPERWPAELRGGVVAIGNFDGVHRGHAALLGRTVAAASARGVPPLVLTFDPHPRTFFRPAEPVFRLTPLPARARLFQALGIEGLAVARFDAAFAGIAAEDFIADVLVGQLGVAGAVVGFNFHFGKGRSGDPASLAEAGARLGFTVDVVAPVGADEEVYTSSAVRDALADGDVARANGLLGYRWFVAESVIHGEQRGRDLGYPTANMALWPDCRLRHGVYAVTVRLADGRTFDGVASYGRRPTFDNGAPLLETHLFDFAGELYGQTAVVAFVDWLRPEEKFASIDDLMAAMDRDAAEARQRIAAAPPLTELDRALAVAAW